jgi:hypothetical protein
MSLDILEFPSVHQLNGNAVAIPAGAPIKKSSLAAAGTFSPATSLDFAIVEFYANGAAHTFHWGNATIVQSLKSGERITYSVPKGTVITVVT